MEGFRWRSDALTQGPRLLEQQRTLVSKATKKMEGQLSCLNPDEVAPASHGYVQVFEAHPRFCR